MEKGKTGLDVCIETICRYTLLHKNVLFKFDHFIALANQKAHPILPACGAKGFLTC